MTSCSITTSVHEY